MNLKNFNFPHFWQSSWSFAENKKKVNILETVTDRAISTEFLIHRLLTEYYM